MNNKRVSLTSKKRANIHTSVKRLLISSRATLKRKHGHSYVRKYRFFVNEPDYTHAYGILRALYLVGFLESTMEVQEMFISIQDEVLFDDEDWRIGHDNSSVQ